MLWEQPITISIYVYAYLSPLRFNRVAFMVALLAQVLSDCQWLQFINLIKSILANVNRLFLHLFSLITLSQAVIFNLGHSGYRHSRRFYVLFPFAMMQRAPNIMGAAFGARLSQDNEDHGTYKEHLTNDWHCQGLICSDSFTLSADSVGLPLFQRCTTSTQAAISR